MLRRMKMSAVGTVTLLLLSCSAITSTDAERKCNYYTAVGGSAVLRGSQWQDPLRLRWMHGSKKVHDSVTPEDNKYSVDENGSLMLKNVTKDNEGEYVSEVLDNGVFKNKMVAQLCIIEKIPKPEVKFKCSSSSVTFNCTTSEQMDAFTYQWSEGGKVLENQQEETLVRRSNQLGGNSFSCKVSISTLSETSKAVEQNCLKPVVTGSSSEKKTLFGLDFWLMVGILAGGGGLVLVLIVITIVCCTKARRKKDKQGEEERELRLEWSNTQQQQHPPHHRPHNQHHPHPDHHRQQQHQQHPAGHTGPRQQRPKQPRPRAPEHGNEYPQPSPRRPAQTSRPAIGVNEEKPPPLPQPRKKTPRM